MKFYRTTARALSISYDGLKEAIMAVAERVSRRVEVAKLHLQAGDAEARLRQNYEALGHCLYATHAHQAPESLKMIDEALPLCESIRAEQRVLQGLRDRLASYYDETLVVSLIGLQEDLRAGGGSIERVTVSPGAHAESKRPAELTMPESVRIVLIRRGESLLFPNDDVLLRAGDQVTLIGNRSAIPAVLQMLRT